MNILLDLQFLVGLTNDTGRSVSFRVAHLAAISAKCGVSSSQCASAQNWRQINRLAIL